jgi:uncharacterized protein
VRVLLDANVFVSALLSQTGAPARIVGLWSRGELELVVCPALLDELGGILARPRLRSRIDAVEAERFLSALSVGAESVPDPDEPPPLRTVDPDDDYLVALATRERVPLVSGDKHLLALRGQAPVLSPREFLEQIAKS